MSDLENIFATLAKSVDLSGVLAAEKIPGRSSDYIARGPLGEPIWLLASVGGVSYKAPIRLRHLSVDFGVKCTIRNSSSEPFDGEFVVIACAADDRELYGFFLNVVEAVLAHLPSPTMQTDVQRSVESLVELFRKLESPSPKIIKGLWAELFTIHISSNPLAWLDAWHATSKDKFDFSWRGSRAEVKATEGPQRVHEFSLTQLENSPEETIVVSILLRRNSSGLDVIELAKLISAHIGDNRPDLITKLWANVSEVLGADFAENLEIRFDSSFASSTMRVIKAADIAKPTITDARVFDVRFKVDVSELADQSALVLSDFADICN